MLSLFPFDQGENVLIQFPAGKCVFTQLPSGKYQVSPDMRRGLIQFINDSNMLHIKWINLSNGKAEYDHRVLFGTISKLKKVNTGREIESKDRVYMLKFTNDRANLMFWMQNPDSSEDEEIVKQANSILLSRVVSGRNIWISNNRTISNGPTLNVGHRTAPLPLFTGLAPATVNSNNNATGPTVPPPVPPPEPFRRTRPSPESATPAVVATTTNAVSTNNQTNSITTELAPAVATISGDNTNATRSAVPPPVPPPEPVRRTRPSPQSATSAVVAAVNDNVSNVSLVSGNNANLSSTTPATLRNFPYREELKKLILWGVKRAFAESCLLDTQGDLLKALKKIQETLRVSIQNQDSTSGSITHQWFTRVYVAIRSWLPNFKENGEKNCRTVYVMHVAVKSPLFKAVPPSVGHQNWMFTWQLLFRYNQFRSLYSSVSPLVHRLLSHSIPDIPYPGFHSGTSFVYSRLPKFPMATMSDWMFGPTDQQRNDRMLKLHAWLEALVCHPLLMTEEEIRHMVWEFLEVDKHVIGV